MRRLSVIGPAMACLASPAWAEEPLKAECPPTRIERVEADKCVGRAYWTGAVCYFYPPIQARIVGNKGDLVEIHGFVPTGNGRGEMRHYFSDYSEMRASMGGASDQLDCGDVRSFGFDVIAVRAGHRNDQVHAYGLFRDENRTVRTVQRDRPFPGRREHRRHGGQE